MSKKRSFKHFDEAARTVIEITENGFNITRQKVAEFLQCSEAAIELFKSVPKEKLNTMTFDNGKEFAGHIAISKDLNVEIFFADP